MAVARVPGQDVHGSGQHRSDHRPRARVARRLRFVRGRGRGRDARGNVGRRRQIEDAGRRSSAVVAVGPPAEGARPKTQISQILPITFARKFGKK